MKVVPDIKGQTIEAFVKRFVSDDDILVSDGAKAYQQLGGEYKAVSMRFNLLQNPDHLQWFHKVIWNAKRLLPERITDWEGSTCNDTSTNSSFVLIGARRFESEWFSRLLEATISSCPFTYAEITA